MSGLTMYEVKNKIEEEARKKAAEAANSAAKQALDEADDTGDEPGLKRLKRTTSAGDDEEDIDEDEQLMYLQAVQEQDEAEAEIDETEAEVHAPPAKRVKKAVQDPSQTTRSRSPQKVPSASLSATAKAKAKPRSSVGSGHAKENAEMKQMPKLPAQALAAGAPAATGTIGDRKTWGASRSIKELHLSDDTCGDLFKAPSVLQKSTQQSKWTAEAVKQKPWLLTLEKVLEGDKVTDQQFKSAFTAAKKVNTKTDKRLEYESEANGQKLFTVRVSKLRSMLENLKELRALVYSCTKQGVVIEASKVEDWISKVQADLQEILPPPDPSRIPFWIGYPEHWVQVGSCRPSYTHLWRL